MANTDGNFSFYLLLPLDDSNRPQNFGALKYRDNILKKGCVLLLIITLISPKNIFPANFAMFTGYITVY